MESLHGGLIIFRKSTRGSYGVTPSMLAVINGMIFIGYQEGATHITWTLYPYIFCQSFLYFYLLCDLICSLQMSISIMFELDMCFQAFVLHITC